VERTLHMLNELRDIVQGKPRFEITEIADRYLEGPPPGGGAPAFQPPAQRLVDDLAEGRPALCDSVLSLAARSSSDVSVAHMHGCYNQDIMTSKDSHRRCGSPAQCR
jgi:hypothetical protein